MIFSPENCDKIHAKTKTMTRRLVGRRWYKAGQVWAIQPGRTLKATGHILLTDVRQDRLWNITTADVLAEGCADLTTFVRLWDRLNPRNPWESDPAVWVLAFELVEA